MEKEITYRVKKIHIKDKKTITRMKEIFTSANNLYNTVLFIQRNAITGHFDKIPEYVDLLKKDEETGEIKKGIIHKYALRKRMNELNNKDYRNFFHTHTGDNIIYQVAESFTSYFKNKNKKRNFPGYIKSKNEEKSKKLKETHNCISIPGESIRQKDNQIVFPKKFNIEPIDIHWDNNNKIKEIQFHCMNEEYYFIIVYEKQIQTINYELDYNKYLGVDIGVTNLMACITNEGNSLIINGRPIKSINRYSNKEIAKYQSFIGNKGTSHRIQKLYTKRNNKIDYYMNIISTEIIKYCIENKIGNIVIGKNKEWKQNCDIGKKNNQNFIQIPHAKLIDKITYKAKEVNINVETVEESYTSKCDALAMETIEKHETYIGKRITRSLFKNSEGKLINADINGALNILRSYLKNDEFLKKINLEQIYSPKKITI